MSPKRHTAESLLTTIIFFVPVLGDLCKVWIMLVIFLVLIPGWLLFSPLELQIDTKTPHASFRWINIGKAMISYERDRWWVSIRILFFYKRWELEKLIFRKRKKRKTGKRIKKETTRRTDWLRKIVNIIKSFKVVKWQVAIDTGDTTENAWLYPLNFLPDTRKHCYINFSDENYLMIKIRNAPWKVVYALFK